MILLKALYGPRLPLGQKSSLKHDLSKLYSTSESLQDKLVDGYSFGREEAAVECFIKDLNQLCGEIIIKKDKKEATKADQALATEI